MRISIRQLQIIDAIVQTHSYSSAAERLHMTQPAVSMQMKNLESNIGLTLFERKGKHIVLTSAGKEVHRFSHNITVQYDDLLEAIHEIKELHHGRIKVSSATTANHLITQMIANFSKVHTGISVALDITNRQQLLTQLADMEPDIVLMGEPPATMDVISEKLIPNPLVIIAHLEHPLASQDNIPFTDMEKYEFIIREEGSGTRATIERFFYEREIEFNSNLTMGSNEAIKHAVIAGLGLGIVSLHTLKLELEAEKLTILDVEHFPLQRYWHIVRRKGKHLLPAVAQFQKFMVKEAKRYAEGYQQFLKK